MYMEKMAKELKNNGFFDNDRGYTAEKKYHRNERTSLLTNRRYSKSISLKLYRSWKYNINLPQKIILSK